MPNLSSNKESVTPLSSAVSLMVNGGLYCRMFVTERLRKKSIVQRGLCCVTKNWCVRVRASQSEIHFLCR